MAELDVFDITSKGCRKKTTPKAKIIVDDKDVKCLESTKIWIGENGIPFIYVGPKKKPVYEVILGLEKAKVSYSDENPLNLIPSNLNLEEAYSESNKESIESTPKQETKSEESRESRKTIADCTDLELFDYLKKIINELEKRRFKYPF